MWLLFVTMVSFIEKVKYAIHDIHLSISDIFLYSTKFGKLLNNAHDSAYEFMRNSGKDVCKKYDLSSIYTLSAIYTIDYDPMWSTILSKQQYTLFQENGEYVLGYIVIHNGNCSSIPNSFVDHRLNIAYNNNNNNNIHFIDFMDTQLPRYKLGAFMIKLYECMFSYGTHGDYGCIACFPRKITNTSVVYWRKYFEKHNVFCLDDLQFIIKEYQISRIIEWDILMHEYCRYNTTIWRK